MLWRSLQICYGLLFACALEVFPPLNDLFQLAEFPDTVGESGVEWTNDEGYVPPHFTLPFMSSLNQIVQSIGFPFFISGLMVCDTILTFLSERVILQIFEETATKKT
jgi:cation-transporting ATPase 13A1